MKEYVIYSLMRSGHHAVCNWIYRNLSGKIVYANDVKNKIWNPAENDDRIDKVICHFEEGKSLTNSLSEVRSNIVRCKHYPLLGKNVDPDLSKLDWDHLIYAIEDEPHLNFHNGEIQRGEQFSFSPNEKHRLIGISKGDDKCSILILRDPFNFMASRIEYQKRTRFDMLSEAMDFWKTQAREYLRITKKLKGEFIPINFNSWTSSKTYRKELSEKFDMNNFRDLGCDEIPAYGNGSSFTQRSVVPTKDVLYRYKQVKKCFRYVDKEAIELAELIFKNSLPFKGNKDNLFEKTFQKKFL